MADPGASTAIAQAVAVLKHDNVQLQKTLSEVNHQNQTLRKQLFHVSTLLDVAVSKLASLGVLLETPVDVRAMRAELAKQEVVHSPGASVEGGGSMFFLKADAQPAQPSYRFHVKRDIRSHTEAVHCAAFGPADQSLIATGGLDRKLLLHNFYSGEKISSIDAHDQNISDVAWFEGSGNLLSASFDSTVKLWDPRGSVATSLYTYAASGFVLSLVPLDKSFVFACADSKRTTTIVDTRARKSFSWEHESRVNSITCDSSAAKLITGDSNGIIAVWDLRKLGTTLSQSTSGTAVEEEGPSDGVATTVTLPAVDPNNTSTGPPASKPLSMLAAATSLGAMGTSIPANSPALRDGGVAARLENEPSHSPISYVTHANTQEDAKRLVVVSADNMVRVFRGRSTNSGAEPYTLRNLMAGVPSRGYTIKASFWQGKRDKTAPHFFEDSEREPEQRQRRLTECDLVATGGADNSASIFDVTDIGESVLVQRLDGHRDRVLGATFHGAESRPIIATYSADSTVKIWFHMKH